MGWDKMAAFILVDNIDIDQEQLRNSWAKFTGP